jgi:hypothetical protein
MSIAGILGRIAGTITAEIVWAVETGTKAGMKPVVVYYGGKLSYISYKEISKIAVKHSIDSNNPEKVTENLFDCLEFID